MADRDKTSKYETSPNCRALSEIAKRYIAADGLKQSAPCTADRIAEGAHAKAWKLTPPPPEQAVASFERPG
jgi:hypothetical protein